MGNRPLHLHDLYAIYKIMGKMFTEATLSIGEFQKPELHGMKINTRNIRVHENPLILGKEFLLHFRCS